MPEKPIFGPISNEELSGKDKKKSLELVNLIKEKRFRNIKGRTCTNGSLQKKYLNKDESVYSPTCSTESLMSTRLIYAMEHHDVAVLVYQKLTSRLRFHQTNEYCHASHMRLWISCLRSILTKNLMFNMRT